MSKSKLEIILKTIPETSVVVVGGEGEIRIRENGKVTRILTADQARDLVHALENALKHSEGRLVGDGV